MGSTWEVGLEARIGRVRCTLWSGQLATPQSSVLTCLVTCHSHAHTCSALSLPDGPTLLWLKCERSPVIAAFTATSVRCCKPARKQTLPVLPRYDVNKKRSALAEDLGETLGEELQQWLLREMAQNRSRKVAKRKVHRMVYLWRKSVGRACEYSSR